ncbi:hypothetical protein [Amycolatopsis anabasis]|uniref:hypothetical protein n=1 Tax=Amycolatopsis anabasis TaxID=1840409 RepID=UPI00131BD7B5|nr:hypothetical protein [Amycolatopsis anabasis]
MNLRYVGGGPYCYASSLSMILGDQAPPPATLEVLTGSPFGLSFEGDLPFFDPPGWDPEVGIAAALDLLGWTCERTSAASGAEAIDRLRAATEPVLAGPVEMGLFRHQPGSGEAIGADHYVVVLGIEDGLVRFHDPHGHPHATLPVEEFAAAWRTDAIGYPCESFTLRGGFRRVRRVEPDDAVRAAMVVAADRLPGSAEAALRLADLVEAGPSDELRGHLVHFAVRLGARRLADAADVLGEFERVAESLGTQARLVGALQYPLTTGDDGSAARLLRTLAPGYERLRPELLQVISKANVLG